MDNLHIYAQGDWHGEAFIVGSSVALKKLRAAIDSALNDGGGATSSFVNDGEGFDIVVVRVDNAAEFAKLAVPYVNEIAKEKGNKKGPWDMKAVHKLLSDCQEQRRRPKKEA